MHFHVRCQRTRHGQLFALESFTRSWMSNCEASRSTSSGLASVKAHSRSRCWREGDSSVRDQLQIRVLQLPVLGSRLPSFAAFAICPLNPEVRSGQLARQTAARSLTREPCPETKQFPRAKRARAALQSGGAEKVGNGFQLAQIVWIQISHRRLDRRLTSVPSRPTYFVGSADHFCLSC